MAGILIAAIAGFLAFPVLVYLGPKLLAMLKKTSEKW